MSRCGRLLGLVVLWAGAGCAGKGTIPPTARSAIAFPGPTTSAPLAVAEVTPILRDSAPMNLLQVLELAGVKPNIIRHAEAELQLQQAGLGHYATAEILPPLVLGEEFQYHKGSIPVRIENWWLNTGRRHFFGLRAMYPFIHPVKIPTEIVALSATRDAAAEMINWRRVDSTASGAGLYFDLQLRQALVIVAREGLARAKEFLQVAASREREKVGLTVDRLWAEAEVAKRDEAVVAAAERFKDASAMLATFLRLDPTVLLYSNEPVVRPVTFFSPDSAVDGLIGSAHGNRSDLRQVTLLAKAAEYRLTGSKIVPFSPYFFGGIFGLDGGLGMEGADWISWTPRADILAGVFWRAPGLGTSFMYLIMENVAKLGAALVTKDIALLESANAVIKAHQAIRARFFAIEAAKRELAAAEEATTLTIKRLEQGLGIAAEVLAAIEARTVAATRLVTAITDYNTNQLKLVGLLGEFPGKGEGLVLSGNAEESRESPPEAGGAARGDNR